MHARQQIIAAIRDALIPQTAADVEAGRAQILPVDFSSAVLIYGREETVEYAEQTMGGRPRILLRQLSLTIECTEKAAGLLDEELDARAEEIEKTLGGSTLGGMLLDLQLQTSSMRMNQDGEQPAGTLVLTYLAQYRTLENTPQTILTT